MCWISFPDCRPNPVVWAANGGEKPLGCDCLESVNGRPLLLSVDRPRPDDVAVFARWLVCQNSWGVLSTISTNWGGAPFGNVVSFSDGLPDKGKGIPYFYLTTLDPTASNALKDQRSSLTISEYNLGTCGKKDPENPTCAKITLLGKLKLLDGDSEEVEFAQTALFTKHPEMKGWPKSHKFQIFKLDIENIFMINWFGGAKPLTVDQYLHTKMDKLVLVADTTS
ncbi:Pyridoxamine 5'-phosphate oxidase family protein [Abeliophyllum distichum]|uniref:Pyridoxamine 5'-phosphate oxidase family protein n=1 Tax=Abeliophyllum distichum TaxID=126358 RepID=A0ABD1V4B4_9LAMI